MIADHTIRIVQTIVATVAVLFGFATLFAGGQVLLGSDPGYEVFRPLLIYNTAMGVAYLAAGVTVWRSVNAGRKMVRKNMMISFFCFLRAIRRFSSIRHPDIRRPGLLYPLLPA